MQAINSGTADAYVDGVPALDTFKLDQRQRGPLQGHQDRQTLKGFTVLTDPAYLSHNLG